VIKPKLFIDVKSGADSDDPNAVFLEHLVRCEEKNLVSSGSGTCGNPVVRHVPGLME